MDTQEIWTASESHFTIAVRVNLLIEKHTVWQAAFKSEHASRQDGNGAAAGDGGAGQDPP